jgi:hypothetical protein
MPARSTVAGPLATAGTGTPGRLRPGQVGQRRHQLALVAGSVDDREALLQLGDGDPALGHGHLQPLGRVRPIGVGDAQTSRPRR